MLDELRDSGPEVSEHLSEDEEQDSGPLGKEESIMADHQTAGAAAVKKEYDAKDPLRPRRKKARRACYACQRAHLTCGDERPCKRCIKRGLAEACQDGVRKKAKYLHDAPEEALGPVLGPNFSKPSSIGRQSSSNRPGPPSSRPTPGGSNFLPQDSAAHLPLYPTSGQRQVDLTDGLSFNAQTSPVNQYYQSTTPTTQPPMDGMLAGNPMDFASIFDTCNPASYNFDLEGLSFGSQYAGWEFGILNRIALGAETPPHDSSVSQPSTTDSELAAIFGNSSSTGYDPSSIVGPGFYGLDTGTKLYTQGNLQHGLPHAYAIAALPTGGTSPSTVSTGSSRAPLEDSPGSTTFGGPPATASRSGGKRKEQKTMQNFIGKRRRDSAAIYAGVREPYPYTTGFHNMISVIKDRLPLNKVSRIARSLSEIRPSFISCTKDLTREDLLFMEKCFQRTLVVFDDFLQHCCAPTIVCRRSGEVAAVNKEFIALTGWPEGVLLGKEPNRNVYSRSFTGATVGGSSQMGDTATRPAISGADPGSGRVLPVFLAELLDDDSVVEFYRDFAQLAFEDSRGKVQRSCGLIKYRPPEGGESKAGPQVKGARAGILSKRVTRIDGEHGISLIEKDGKVNCTYCWTIKRDMFDIPMMIIINFLPRYYPDQEPRQLAV